MRVPWLAAVAIVASWSVCQRALGQTPEQFMSRGVAAYRALDYNAARSLLTSAVAVRGPGAMSDSAQSSAYVFLGAAELLTGRRGPAEDAFRQALRSDARQRLDTLVFPPAITDVFDQVRHASFFLQARVPADTIVRVGDLIHVARLYASAGQAIRAEFVGPQGQTARLLYAGPVVDSLDVPWDGLDSVARTPLEGDLVLQVGPRSGTGGPFLRVPLMIVVSGGDTLPTPPPPDSTPWRQHRRTGSAFRALGAGLLTGMVAVTLPRMVTADGHGSHGRYVLAASLGAAGVLGFVVRPVRPASHDQARTDALNAWRQKVQDVRAQNERLRRDVKMRIVSKRSGDAVAGAH